VKEAGPDRIPFAAFRADAALEQPSVSAPPLRLFPRLALILDTKGRRFPDLVDSDQTLRRRP